MESEDAKNNLFFVGRNRFNYYIIEPLNELISLVNTGINNYNWNPDNLQIPTRYNDKQQIDYIKNEYAENNNRINIKPIESNNIKYQDILYLTFEHVNTSEKLPYEFKFNDDIDINNLIRLKSNIQTYHLINVDGNAYEQQNMDIVIPISIFENIFKTHSKIDKLKLPLTCYFAIVSSNLDNATSLSNNLKELLSQSQQQIIDNVFISDVKDNHNFAGSFLSNLCFNVNENNEYNDDNKYYEIIKYFNNIYVLPCLHEIKGKANTFASYWDVNTDCRYKPDKDNKTNDTLKKYTENLKRKKNCTHIEADNCDSQRAIQYYEIDWSIYKDFYNGYRDEKKNPRQKCRINNFLGLFFFAFVRDVNASGGKKYRKSRKLRRSRKYKKHKSRKYKSRK
jgi:hypothetical protein